MNALEDELNRISNAVESLDSKAGVIASQQYDVPLSLACAIKELAEILPGIQRSEDAQRVRDIYQTITFVIRKWQTYQPQQPSFSLEEISKRVVFWQMIRDRLRDVNIKIMPARDFFRIQLKQMSDIAEAVFGLMHFEVSLYCLHDINLNLPDYEVKGTYHPMLELLFDKVMPRKKFFILERYMFMNTPEFKQQLRGIYDLALLCIFEAPSENDPAQPRRLRMPPSMTAEDLVKQIDFMKKNCAKCLTITRNKVFYIIDCCNHIYCSDCIMFIETNAV